MNKKGGRFYGKGAFGVAMGNPRMTCPDERVEDIGEEVGKIFNKKSNYEEEYHIIQKLQEVLSEKQINQLRQYFIFPIKKCEIDKSTLSDIYKSPEWYKTSKGKTYPHEFRYSRTGDFMYNNTPMTNMYQIVYPQGKHDLVDEFNNLKYHFTEDKLYDVLSKMKNLIDGLHILHKHDMVHGDIKIDNSIVIGDTYKFIDVGQISQISTGKEYNSPSLYKLLEWIGGGFYYYVWSSMSAYVIPFLKNKRNLTMGDLMTYGILGRSIKSYSILLDFMERNYNMLHDNVFGFNDDISDELYKQYVLMCRLRLFGMTSLDPENPRIGEFSLRNIRDIISYFNTHADKPLIFFYRDSPLMIQQAMADIEKSLGIINNTYNIPSGDIRYNIQRIDYIMKMNDLYSIGVMLFDLLSSINTAMITPTMIPVLEEMVSTAIQYMSFPNVPTNWNDYYRNRKSYYNNVFKYFYKIIKTIPKPETPVRRVRSIERRTKTVKHKIRSLDRKPRRNITWKSSSAKSRITHGSHNTSPIL
jgi:hypothetical protein